MSGSASEYCDLVMKGGITSGLVYPSAALSLAGKYRFKNIGGTSAGAIAAAACAAAALGERRRALRSASIADDGSSNSADKAGLAGLKNVADALTGNEFIYRLFQPSLGARAAYRLIVTLASKAGLTKKMVAILLAILATGSLEFLLSLAALAGLAYWLGGPGGVFAAALPAVLCALAISALFGAARVARVMRRNQMGICTGLAPKRRFGKARPALTDWLHQVIQDLSGQGDGEPLLFEHLWNAERYPGEPETARTISLQIITTSVSHREPRTLPLEKGGFWFRREEFDALFPKTVVDWMVEQDASPIQNDTGTYYALPSGGRMPVLVAARMSLSFPLLISAVPLHERDYGSERASVEDDSDPEIEDEIELQKGMLAAAEALATGGTRPKAASAPDAKPIFRVCWFSDGGISSNFPIHLFDSPLPRWPTFAINLVYPKSDDVQRADVFLPTRNDQGWQRCYESIASRTAAAEVTAFLFGIIATMQNWRDILQSRAPGHRDR
ncbi:MAG TPA: patatin-like phospholipase family protein, partial [Dongiaceae bacterium]|nr:patatin-like phospholipase family protein [Dongiaceae bacterium]